MIAADWLLLGAWGVLVNVWAGLWITQRAALRGGMMLEPCLGVPADDAPTLAVVIPARNEAQDIEACLASVLAQDYPGLRVVVVDDRSTDNTPAILQRLATRHPRLTAMRIDHLPPGWMGKTHALHQATRGLDADWLLFMDADCRLMPGAAAAAARAAAARGVALLTLWPRHASGSFFESLLIPLCGGVMALWFGFANHRRGPAFANGQFLLARRADYEAVGGHQAVRHALIEDVPLARVFKRHGRRTWAGGGRELVRVRMYRSLGAIVRGWSRIFIGALQSPGKLALSIAWLLVGSLLPLVALPVLALTALRDEPSLATWAALSMAASHCLLIAGVSLGFWRMGGCDRRYLLLYPLSVLGVIGILLHALWTVVSGRAVVWRDTPYRVDGGAIIRG